MLNAFRYGAPPHGGLRAGHRPHGHAARGRAQYPRGHLFPLNQQGEDLLMGAPAEVPPARWKELHLRPDLPPKKPGS